MQPAAQPLWAAALLALAEGRIGVLPRIPSLRPESAYEMDAPRGMVPWLLPA